MGDINTRISGERKMLYGLEKEFFILKKDEPILAPAWLPCDECGWLAEARGQPCNNITDAIFSLKADIHRIDMLINKHDPDIKIVDNPPTRKISIRLKREAMRRFAKGVVKAKNLYGHDSHRKQSEAYAGVHISFTHPRKIQEHVVNEMWDFADLFKRLDVKFATEIRDAKRNPGFYELKTDGRIEYRSLPADIALEKVIEFFEV